MVQTMCVPMTEPVAKKQKMTRDGKGKYANKLSNLAHAIDQAIHDSQAETQPAPPYCW